MMMSLRVQLWWRLSHRDISKNGIENINSKFIYLLFIFLVELLFLTAEQKFSVKLEMTKNVTYLLKLF